MQDISNISTLQHSLAYDAIVMILEEVGTLERILSGGEHVIPIARVVVELEAGSPVHADEPDRAWHHDRYQRFADSKG